ncbi:MAG TPA: hypothetical protein DCY94_00080 [Firmicutes bacterium]|nr:hypothetical protein [Bacillota bacterium]
MKKKTILTISLIMIIVGAIFLIIYAKSEHSVKGQDELYDLAIEYLKNETEIENKRLGEHDYANFFSYDGFAITAKGNYRYAYMWILSETYYSEGDKIISDHGSSMFYKFTFTGDEVFKYEIPKDGNEYAPSIEKMCPKRISKKVLNYEPHLSNEDDIKEYFSSDKKVE